ncbi:MAG: gliding motility protein GldL [Marinifilaceae bacterium]
MNITELVQSPRWKKFMAYVYGWGAAVVLIGALFKIQHYPYAGVLLTVGMMTEVIIFFFSAFEPPHEQPDWSLVYPELIGLEPRERGGTGNVQIEGIEQLQALLENMSTNPESTVNLQEGLSKLSKTAEKLADLSDASLATENYVNKMNSASESVGKLSENYLQSTEHLSNSARQLVDSYSQTADVISNSGKNVAEQMNQTGSQLAQQINASGNGVLESYKTLNESLSKNFEELTQNNSDYKLQLENMNKNLSSLNSVYELQLNHTNEQIQKSQGMHKNMNEILENLSSSLENAQSYRKETEQLNKNLSALNNIYGNMLSAMDINNNRN